MRAVFLCPVMCQLVALWAGVSRCPRTYSGRRPCPRTVGAHRRLFDGRPRTGPDSGVFRLDRRRSVALTGASAIALMARRPSATRGRRRLSMPVWERRAPCRHVGALANEAVAPSGPVWRRLTRGASLGERRHGERLGSGRVPSRGHRRPPVRLRRRFVPPGNRGFRSGCHICLPGSDIRIEGRKHVTRPGPVTACRVGGVIDDSSGDWGNRARRLARG